MRRFNSSWAFRSGLAGVPGRETYALMLSSEMRPGEARALEWSSITFDIPAVLTIQAFSASEELGETKGKWRRNALLPDRTANQPRTWNKMSDYKTGLVFRGGTGGKETDIATKPSDDVQHPNAADAFG
jgi:integrase